MTFTNKTIHSNRLDKDFDVLCWEMQKKNRVETVVAHEAFEDIVFNQEMPPGFRYEVSPIIGVASYPVMQCTMTDDTGRKIMAIGEAHPNTLINNISRNNPVIMAFNRAFDRAAIRYLDFEGKFYSSAEIPDDKEGNVPDGYNEDDVVESEYNEYETDETMIGEIPAENVTNKVEETEAEEPSPESFGTVVINFGKYKDKKMTVAQIWETNESWATYTSGMNTDRAGKVTKFQVDALKAYGKAIGKIK